MPGARRAVNRLLWRITGASLLLLFFSPVRGNCLGPVAGISKDGEVRTELIDPCVGVHWRLLRDPAHPEWPGRLMLVDASETSESTHESKIAAPLVIRVGELVTVRQDTELLHARFEAVALDAGKVGQRIRVRLRAKAAVVPDFAGRVIAVVATGPGETSWQVVEQNRQ